jgi:hypothetical protein
MTERNDIDCKPRSEKAHHIIRVIGHSVVVSGGIDVPNRSRAMVEETGCIPMGAGMLGREM